MASAFIFLLLGLSIIAYISYPLLRKSQKRLEYVSDKSKIELAEERDRVYRGLEDLALEHECGKISDEDYQQLRQELLAKVESDSAASKPISKSRSTTPEQQLKDSVEAEIAKYKSQKRRTNNKSRI
ncbi:hypothetical protein FJZ31_09505 [Candidatus Poribacteria bacterium]|nr:hypothetical protein [Candidatus Poribacteria bacterium]